MRNKAIKPSQASAPDYCLYPSSPGSDPCPWWVWLLLCITAGVVLGLNHGLSNSWDLQNYHLYNPWALLNNRYGSDIFPAGIQGYFDPLLDIPYYLIAYVWFPNYPHIVAALTGLPFALLLFSDVLLTRRVLGIASSTTNGIGRCVLVAMCASLAASGFASWSQAFTDTGDILVGAIVIFSINLLVKAYSSKHQTPVDPTYAIAIGALLGFAAGLKLTSAIYAPAAGVAILATTRNIESALKAGLLFFTSYWCTFAVLYGPWAIHLYRFTGDPFFPFFNSIFHSPFASISIGRDTRFLPHTVLQLIFDPFYWLDDTITTVNELKFRDARFALAYLAVLGLLIYCVTRYFRKEHYRLSNGSTNHLNRLYIPTGILALAGFWLVAYVTWLLMFSIIRYAVALELSGSILVIGTVICLTRTIPARRHAPAEFIIVAAIVSSTVAFAKIPGWGQIPAHGHVFQANVPKLGRNPMIIFAGAPMAMLAPLIYEQNRHATFIGITSCFRRGSWCYRDYYHYDLGREIRHKIRSHAGAIYVAYYGSRVPAFDYLRMFNVSVNTHHCTPMSTNRTANVFLCQARYVAGAASYDYGSTRWHLAIKHLSVTGSFEASYRWAHNPCATQTQAAQVMMHWSAPPGIGQVRIYLQASPSTPQLFVVGGPQGTTHTGNWVHAGLTFIFRDRAGRLLAKDVAKYEQCTHENTGDHRSKGTTKSRKGTPPTALR